ncbi:HlyD family secretion protein [Halomonas shantousis]
MTPDQRFARWVRLAIALFAVLFAYFVVADLFMPLTPQARAMRQVTQVAPELSGRVVEVDVSSNAHVEAGDVLFRLDPEPYRIAVEKADLALEEAAQQNARLDASLAAARADLTAARADAEELAQEQRRVKRLLQNNSISRQKYDQVVADYRAAEAAVEAAEASIHELEVQRGESGEDNLLVRQARNALANAQLNLRRTTVRAEHAGKVGNLQLEEGAYAQAGVPVMALVGEALDIVADFREKSLRHVDAGDSVRVSFDALPGAVFEARVVSIDAGVREGQQLANGQLTDIPTSDRWVRDAQRLRLHAALEETLPTSPASGARATVQLLPEDHPLIGWFARLQIRLVSLMHYIY